MRRVRRWLIAGVILALVAGGGIAFYFTFVDTNYSKAELYEDTGLTSAEKTPGFCLYVERAGRVTLAIERGEPHGIVTTAHGSIERVAVEMPRPSPGERVEVSGPEVRVYFLAFHDGRMHWTIGEGGVRGHLLIEEVTERRITASYEIVVAAYTERLLPEFRSREIAFRGQSTFRARPRPDGERLGDLWPKPGSQTRQKKRRYRRVSNLTEGYVTLTPLHFDLTNHAALQQMQQREWSL